RAGSRKAGPGRGVPTAWGRVRAGRRMVRGFLASSVDVSLASPDVRRWMERYGADPSRYRDPAPPHDAGERDAARPGEHRPRYDSAADPAAQPAKVYTASNRRVSPPCPLSSPSLQPCSPATHTPP